MTLEQAVHELTGRQAEIVGFRGRGTVASGNIADGVVFALDDLRYGHDKFVHDLPGGGACLRRDAGGYRARIVVGAPV